MKEENHEEMNQLLDSCLGELGQPPPQIVEVAPYVVGAPSVIGAQFVAGVSQTQEFYRVALSQGDSKKGCSFNSFMACKLSEYK